MAHLSVRLHVRGLATVAVALVALLAMSFPARGSNVTVVVPTGVYPTDVENVQAAVDAGGRVLLKATDVDGTPMAFNFGPGTTSPSGVALAQSDVQVMGETVGQAMTTIRGGFVALVVVEKITAQITGIHFDEQRSSAVVWTAGEDGAFVDNRVTDVIGSPVFPGIEEGRGVKFLGNTDPENAITGRVLVADNRFDGLEANLSDAIVLHSVAADMTIRDNRIGTVQNTGMLLLTNSGTVDVHDNVIEPGPGVSTPSFGNGIFVVGGDASYDIRDNRIDSSNPLANAIILSGSPLVGTVDGVTIASNDLTVRDSACCEVIALVGDVQQTTIRANRLSGTVPGGIGLFGTLQGRDPGPTGNALIGNNLHRVDAPTDVFFDANTADNVVVGRVRSVEDLGTGNVIAGHDRGRLGQVIGPAVSEAHTRVLTNDPEVLAGAVPAVP